MKSGIIYGYISISSNGQTILDQMSLISKYVEPCNIIVEEKSGTSITARTKYLDLRNRTLTSGDTLVICSLMCLGRNKNEVLRELKYYLSKHVDIKVLDLPSTLADKSMDANCTSEIVYNTILDVLESFAKNERIMIHQKQRDGIDAAKRAGNVVFGRPKAVKPQNWTEVYNQWKNGEITGKKAMELTNTSRSTFYKFVKEGDINVEK